MKFNKLLSFPVWPDQIRIQWELDNNELTGTYKFRVLQAFSPEGPFEDISGLLFNKNSFTILHTPILYTEIRQDLYFKVTAEPPQINISRGWVPIEEQTTLYHGLDEREFLRAKDIIRRENLRFRKRVGLKVLIFKRRKFGERCTSCLDPLTDAVINSQCLDCFGTRFLGGFHEPFKVWSEIVENPVIKQISDISTTEEKTARIRLTNEILISKKDVILDKINNNKWEVSAEPSITRYRSFPINQECQAFLVSPKSVLNKLDR